MTNWDLGVELQRMTRVEIGVAKIVAELNVGEPVEVGQIFYVRPHECHPTHDHDYEDSLPPVERTSYAVPENWALLAFDIEMNFLIQQEQLSKLFGGELEFDGAGRVK